MQNVWFADHRDLIKWGVLFGLAESFNAKCILQAAFYRESFFGQLIIDGKERNIPDNVITHFRNMKSVESIPSDIRVRVFDNIIQDRETYLPALLEFIRMYAYERCVVFLDPDTGLQPKNPNLKHILNEEVKLIWKEMKSGDVLACYQHQTNRNNEPWVSQKQDQLASALGIECQIVKIAEAPEIAKDVVIMFVLKT